MNFMDPTGLSRQMFGGLQGTPFDNKATEAAFTGGQAFMPQQIKTPSPWTGMQEQEDAEKQAQAQQAAKAYGQLAGGE